jgi:uncharacterized membrane protein
LDYGDIFGQPDKKTWTFPEVTQKTATLRGVVGALIGTYGGFESRRALARAFGRDLPAALIEDAVAIVLALGMVYLA